VHNPALPHLFSFAKLKNITVAKARAATNINQLIHLPISQEAHDQLLLLAHDLDDVPSNDQMDAWTYIWRSPLYQPTKAYRHPLEQDSFWKCSVRKASDKR
jgi:hypothetical protein